MDFSRRIDASLDVQELDAQEFSFNKYPQSSLVNVQIIKVL